MNHSTSNMVNWLPLAPDKLTRIRKIFSDLFPVSEYGGLAEQISDYWTTTLKNTWRQKPDPIRQKDLAYRPGDPLSRIHQKTVVIAYADSIFEKCEKTLKTLDKFLSRHFPAIGGLHILPACQVDRSRFNDGYFSQILRNKIDPVFGTHQLFADLAEKYFSMTDFVLNHVDIDNPRFRSFLNGDDASGDCFFVFSESEYQKRRADGDFDTIFRPRPFPLFTIFRRVPADKRFAEMDAAGRVLAMNQCLAPGRLPEAVLALLSIFNKIQNDQMLLKSDYSHISKFIEYLKQHTTISPDVFFTLSETQETRHPPYIFKKSLRTKAGLLTALGHDAETARKYAAAIEENDAVIFGEEIRALTTFSHVQVDLNTTTFEGLKMLCDDFAWYLSMDLNMLRLDAANYAFKRWKTSCFGLPEVKSLMKILYLSMDCVSPRIVANLEVNDQLSAILNQMANRESPPPMMYDFHLPCLLPVIFNSENTEIAARIFDMICQYDISRQSIRFSVADTHDGKSVRGSLDLLTSFERQSLAQIVETNGGKIKTRTAIQGTEPYELCTSTRDALVKMDDPTLEADRFLAFYTMAFALTGRHVKSIYFNDLTGLANDYDRMAKTGELRDIKRTKSDYEWLRKQMDDPDTIFSKIAKGLNRLIAIVDADPALCCRGNEAKMISTGNPAAGCIFNHYERHYTLTIINTSGREEFGIIDLSGLNGLLPAHLEDRFSGQFFEILMKKLKISLKPFERLWLK